LVRHRWKRCHVLGLVVTHGATRPRPGSEHLQPGPPSVSPRPRLLPSPTRALPGPPPRTLKLTRFSLQRLGPPGHTTTSSIVYRCTVALLWRGSADQQRVAATRSLLGDGQQRRGQPCLGPGTGRRRARRVSERQIAFRVGARARAVCLARRGA
jgi:hypothetical protein